MLSTQQYSGGRNSSTVVAGNNYKQVLKVINEILPGDELTRQKGWMDWQRNKEIVDKASILSVTLMVSLTLFVRWLVGGLSNGCRQEMEREDRMK